MYLWKTVRLLLQQMAQLLMATNQVKADLDGLEKLIAAIKENANVLDVDSREAAYESLEVIETESAAEKPKKSMIKTALGT